MLHIIEFNMDEWKDQEKYVYLCFFFKIIVLFYFYFFFQSQVWGLPPFQYFHHVPHILRHCTQHHGRSFWRTWSRHQTLISEKWPKIVKKGPQKTITWYSFRKPLTFFIIVLNVMVIAFGGPAPGLHYTSNFDTISEIKYVFELFFYL